MPQVTAAANGNVVIQTQARLMLPFRPSGPGSEPAPRGGLLSSGRMALRAP